MNKRRTQQLLDRLNCIMRKHSEPFTAKGSIIDALVIESSVFSLWHSGALEDLEKEFTVYYSKPHKGLVVY